MKVYSSSGDSEVKSLASNPHGIDLRDVSGFMACMHKYNNH
jgi:hypothetical protein